ncbi:hypothetical protein JAAARDRAFT_28968 [Jaapia argillacea MUCL 33604]|uniref:Thioredoxin domain-containing protein n=1 Tax=Jaapia argillacea MUCL 33604 TaxID=933084 RepID=A0A067QA13_9AGAM|nr:hypothetical protein JAAARDRAFT_28968 [Jaapia argillacea MUCL 33604]
MTKVQQISDSKQFSRVIAQPTLTVTHWHYNLPSSSPTPGAFAALATEFANEKVEFWSVNVEWFSGGWETGSGSSSSFKLYKHGKQVGDEIDGHNMAEVKAMITQALEAT